MRKPPAVPEEEEISITADRTRVRLPSQKGSYKIKIISSDTSWMVTKSIDWLEATKLDHSTLQVSHKKNVGDERRGKVTVTLEEESVEITVAQTAGPYLTLQRAEYTLSYEKNDAASIDLDISFFRSAKYWYLAVPDEGNLPDWLRSVTPDGSVKSPVSSQTAFFDVEENITAMNRSFTLELRVENAADDLLASADLEIYQSKAVIIVSESDRMLTTADALAGNQTISVSITNGENWEIAHYQDVTDPANPIDDPLWITPTKRLAGLKLSYQENTHASARKAIITLTVGSDRAHALTIEFNQLASLVITVRKYEDGVASSALSDSDALDNVSSAPHKDTLLVEISDGSDWIHSGPSWVTLNKIDGVAQVPDTLEIVYSENRGAAQSGTIMMTAVTATFDINISQDAPLSSARRRLINRGQ